MHNVVPVDISYRKKSAHLRKARDMYCDVMDGLSYVGTMVQHWNECINKLYQVEKLAYSKLNYSSEIELSFYRPVVDFIQKIKSDAMPHIRSSDMKLKHLTQRKDKYAEVSRSQAPFYYKASIIKAYHYEVDVLSLLVKWLGIEECQYWAAPVDDGRFLGAVMLSFPFGQDIAPYGDMCIEADHDESNTEDAKNRVARQAISYLEDQFNVEVVGFNHNEAVAAEYEMSLISLLKKELMFLGATVAKLWEEMLKKVDECVHANKHVATLVQLDSVAAECTALWKVDVAKFETQN